MSDQKDKAKKTVPRRKLKSDGGSATRWLIKGMMSVDGRYQGREFSDVPFLSDKDGNELPRLGWPDRKGGQEESARVPENKLPETYKGYSTKELLDMLEKIGRQESLKGNPREKISAMRDLAREYQLTPIHQHSPKPALIRRGGKRRV